MDPKAIAASLAEQQFSDAVGVWLVGSSARDEATATSDVDVLVVRRDGPVYRHTFASGGALVELFVHTVTSLGDWYASESREYRCTLAHMLATGNAVARSADGETLQTVARAHVDSGPPARAEAELDALRYHLTSVVDDLVGSGDEDEAVFIGHEVVLLASELELARRGTWTGRGQWLFRWLKASIPGDTGDTSVGDEVV